MRERYEIRDGVVFDHLTGLEWEAESHGPMTWPEAMAYAEGLGEGWRLPTMDELLTLVDHARHFPASTFPDMLPEHFWSSSAYADYPKIKLIVRFAEGSIDRGSITLKYHVRCVRGEASGGAPR